MSYNPPQLQSEKITSIVETRVSDNQTTDFTSYARVYSGADQTAVNPSKIGDIFIKDDGAIYVANGTDGSTDWVALDVTGA